MFYIMPDYTIIGAGPTGLTLAWCLAQYGKTVLLIEREDSIGGCHRVRRVNGLFTEHGPRIYMGNGKNYQQILKEIGYDFDKHFTKYVTGISSTSELLKVVGLNELYGLTIEFIRYLIYPKYSKNITVKQFTDKYKFSQKAADLMNKLCVVTDGAFFNRYTLYGFFQLANQNILTSLYQPKVPNDIGMMKVWRDALLKTGKVDILTSTEIESIIDPYNLIAINNGKRFKIKTGKTVIATAPRELVKLLNKSNDHIRTTFNDLTSWEKDCRYITYIPITFHFDKKLDLPKSFAEIPTGDWGVIKIVLSNYMKLDYPTVLSVCIVNLDTISEKTKKTVNQSTKKEIIDETFRQLKEYYPNLPEPKHAIVSPGVYRTNHKWETKDSSFILTPVGYKDLRHGKIPDLHAIGTFGTKSPYTATSIEAAVSNAFGMLHDLIPDSKSRYPIKRAIYLTDLLILSLVIFFILIIYFLRR